MSHIEEGKTTLKLTTLAEAIRQNNPGALHQHPCMTLLRQAVTMVAQAHHGGVVGTTYENYSGQSQSTNTHLALMIPGELPRGIGLFIDEQTGALSFKGDPWEHRIVFSEVQQKIVQNYVVLAHAAALRRMRARVSTQLVDDQVVITGVFNG